MVEQIACNNKPTSEQDESAANSQEEKPQSCNIDLHNL